MLPNVEGLELAYALHPLPPGRFGFRRWRWELWHGARLIAAGWRVHRADAAQALRAHGTDFAHQVFGLRPPPRVTGPALDMQPGISTRIDAHGVSFVLVPRNLEPARATA
ncbi:MAG: hypothetical protein M3P44_14445 [Actinomycetota bacterium]|nr:hypothetical protein [Actinomycetota bacterium]